MPLKVQFLIHESGSCTSSILRIVGERKTRSKVLPGSISRSLSRQILGHSSTPYNIKCAVTDLHIVAA